LEGKLGLKPATKYNFDSYSDTNRAGGTDCPIKNTFKQAYALLGLLFMRILMKNRGE
jgi:hypothetical protein